jgi:hypothetical protein
VASRKFPAIPIPRPDVQALFATVEALRNTVNTLTGQLGDGSQRAIQSSEVPQVVNVKSVPTKVVIRSDP